MGGAEVKIYTAQYDNDDAVSVVYTDCCTTHHPVRTVIIGCASSFGCNVLFNMSNIELDTLYFS